MAKTSAESELSSEGVAQAVREWGGAGGKPADRRRIR